GSAPADLLGPEGPLVEVLAFAPLARAVGVVDGHADHGDGGVDAGQRADARDAPAGAHDDPTVDLLAQNRVGAADVAGALGRDGRRFDAEAELAEALGGVEHALVASAAALLEREVVVVGLDLEAEHLAVEEAQSLAEQLFPGLVAMQ